MKDISNFGTNIAIMRKQKGLTQNQLALLVGVTAQAVSKWETNESLPDIALLPKIAEIFRTSIDTLFSSFDEKSPASINIMTERLERVRTMLEKNGDGSAIVLNHVSGCKMSPSSSALHFKGRSLQEDPGFFLFVSDAYLEESKDLDSNTIARLCGVLSKEEYVHVIKCLVNAYPKFGIRRTRNQIMKECEVTSEVLEEYIAISKELSTIKEDPKDSLYLTTSGMVIAMSFLGLSSCFRSMRA